MEGSYTALLVKLTTTFPHIRCPRLSTWVAIHSEKWGFLEGLHATGTAHHYNHKIINSATPKWMFQAKWPHAKELVAKILITSCLAEDSTAGGERHFLLDGQRGLSKQRETWGCVLQSHPNYWWTHRKKNSPVLVQHTKFPYWLTQKHLQLPRGQSELIKQPSAPAWLPAGGVCPPPALSACV